MPTVPQGSTGHTARGLLDLHLRSHSALATLLTHCRQLTAQEVEHEHEGFGIPSVRLQVHHGLVAERYWIGVLGGLMLDDDDATPYPTIASLEALREEVSAATQECLERTGDDELNQPRRMLTWGGRERVLVPAQVVLRTVTHHFHHIGQIAAMCRLLGKPSPGSNYPIDDP